MDHFAKPDDELAVAQRQGRLTRDFQGYSRGGDCDLVGLGVSAIGKIGAAYAQNHKTLDDLLRRARRAASCRCCAASSSAPTTWCAAR